MRKSMISGTRASFKELNPSSNTFIIARNAEYYILECVRNLNIVQKFRLIYYFLSILTLHNSKPDILFYQVRTKHATTTY